MPKNSSKDILKINTFNPENIEINIITRARLKPAT